MNKAELDRFVNRREEIRRKELYDGSSTYCYMVAFPDTFDDKLARSCRGLILSPDGMVRRRPFQKFFNVNERNETQTSFLDKKKIKAVFEKVDGTMLSPWIDGFGEMHFDTKKLNMEMREQIEGVLPENIFRMSRELLLEAKQPIFEFYHPEIPETNIVVQYPDMVVRLLAIRDMEHGTYVHPDTLERVAKKHGVRTAKRFRELEKLTTSDIVVRVNDFSGAEGVVIYYADGTMVKLKCPWYMERFHVFDAFSYPHRVVQLVLNEGAIDDMASTMTPQCREKYELCSEQLHQEMSRVVHHVMSTASRFKTKKEYGLSGEKDRFANLIFKVIGSDVNASDVFAMVKKDVLDRWSYKLGYYEEFQEAVSGLI